MNAVIACVVWNAVLSGLWIIHGDHSPKNVLGAWPRVMTTDALVCGCNAEHFLQDLKL